VTKEAEFECSEAPPYAMVGVTLAIPPAARESNSHD